MEEMDDNSSLNTISDRRAARRQRRGVRRGGEWMLGIMLILLAVILFMQNLKVITFTNWWALFILLPALGSFGTAWRLASEAGGRFSARARGAVIVGLLLVLVTGMFLLQLNWVILGPVLLVVAGIGLFANSLLPE
jgi:hypothetical protein